MAILNLINATQIFVPGGVSKLWQIIILNWLSFVPHYAWRIVVFTVFLKLVLSPLDIYQRVAMRKNQKITERIAPELEKLKAQYANDKQALAQKQMALNKKEGFSYFSSCLPMIVTLVIFFWLLSGLNNISQYMSMKQYVAMYDVYIETQTEIYEKNGMKDGNIDPETKTDCELTLLDEFGTKIKISSLSDMEEEQYADFLEANDEAIKIYENGVIASARVEGQKAAEKLYIDELSVGFLWIRNVWSPDVFWKKAIPEKKQFVSNIGKYESKPERYGDINEGELKEMIGLYDDVTETLRKNTDVNKRNGWVILPILSVGLSFLSQFIMSRQQKKSGQVAENSQGTMKMMMMIMPVMMGVFALTYTSVFTLYIITNSFMTLLINLSTTGIIALISKRENGEVISIRTAKPNSDGVIRYGRPDPNAKVEKTEPAGKKKKKE